MDETSEKSDKIVKLLAEQLGLEPDDIARDDSLVADLHMQPSEITDFLQFLEQAGFDISRVDLTQIDTVDDISEALNL